MSEEVIKVFKMLLAKLDEKDEKIIKLQTQIEYERENADMWRRECLKMEGEK